MKKNTHPLPLLAALRAARSGGKRGLWFLSPGLKALLLPISVNAYKYGETEGEEIWGILTCQEFLKTCSFFSGIFSSAQRSSERRYP
jgi:hypothetical protein